MLKYLASLTTAIVALTLAISTLEAAPTSNNPSSISSSSSTNPLQWTPPHEPEMPSQPEEGGHEMLRKCIKSCIHNVEASVPTCKDRFGLDGDSPVQLCNTIGYVCIKMCKTLTTPPPRTTPPVPLPSTKKD